MSLSKSLRIDMLSGFRLQICNSIRLTNPNQFTSPKIFNFSIPTQQYHQINSGNFPNNCIPIAQNQAGSCFDAEAFKVQSLLKIHSDRPIEEIEHRLNECGLSLSRDLILNVLKRHRSDWKPAYVFFKWVCKTVNLVGVSPDASVYNEIVDTLGRMKRFDEAQQVLDEMSSRKNLINERTYAIMVSRFSAAHKVEEAIGVFNRMEDFGLDRSVAAFQTLVLSLCRYKHVEEAELLFRSRKNEFPDDIKTWNIILNGWCFLRSLPDAKRFWKDIIRSEVKPDKYTYGIFINSLCKSGKITTARELLGMMWEKGFNPDVAICNTVIDGLCFKKRIPEALQIFGEMNRKNCPPNVATYNSLIKHLCKVLRMDKVHELVNEMEEKGGTCSPNTLTYGLLLRSSSKPEKVDEVLRRMEMSGCKMDANLYNLVLRLFLNWGDEERVKCVWDEMQRSGLGPDQRSYTIMVHGLYDKGVTGTALDCFNEMVSKGMVPEPRTVLLAEDMKLKLNERNTTTTMGNHNITWKLPP